MSRSFAVTFPVLTPSPFSAPSPCPLVLRERVRLMRARNEVAEALRSVGEALAVQGGVTPDAALLLDLLARLSEVSGALDVACASRGA